MFEWLVVRGPERATCFKTGLGGFLISIFGCLYLSASMGRGFGGHQVHITAVIVTDARYYTLFHKRPWGGIVVACM